MGRDSHKYRSNVASPPASPRTVSIRLCGGLQVEVDGERVEGRLTRRKSRELLGLLVDRAAAVSREELVELLWPESAPGSRVGQLRVLLTELRHCLGGEAIEGRDQLRVVLPESAWVDVQAGVAELERCRAAIEERRWPKSRIHAQEASELLRGGFLTGYEAEWIEDRRAELERLELEAIEALAASCLSEPGHAPTAVAAARRLVSRAPFRESGYSLLMRALVSEGNPAEALVAYERLRLLLREELGTVPSVALSALHRWVLEQADEAGTTAGGEDSEPETHYARRRDGVNIAYLVLGDGPVDLVLVPGFMSHIDMQWADPSYRRWLLGLASSVRVITLDKAGTGASDVGSGAQSLREWGEDVMAVLDAVGSSRAVLYGCSDGAQVAAGFANSHPERVRALVLYGGQARVLPNKDYLWEHREEIRAAVNRFSEAQLRWGCGGSVEILAPTSAGTEAARRAWAVFERAFGPPASIRARAREGLAIDICGLLPQIKVPTLVLHRAGDRLVPVHHGRYLAAAIPGARYIELAGNDHMPSLGDTETLVTAIHEFIAALPADEQPNPTAPLGSRAAVQRS